KRSSRKGHAFGRGRTVDDVPAGDVGESFLHFLPELLVLLVVRGVQLGNDGVTGDGLDPVRTDGQVQQPQISDRDTGDVIEMAFSLRHNKESMGRGVEAGSAEYGDAYFAGVPGPEGFGLDGKLKIAIVVDGLDEAEDCFVIADGNIL